MGVQKSDNYADVTSDWSLGGRPHEQSGVVRAGDGEVDEVQPQLAHVRLALADLERSTVGTGFEDTTCISLGDMIP